MAMEGLKDALIEELQDIYDAEHRIVNGLQAMRDAANNAELRDAFGKHLGQTKGQIERLEEAFKALGETPKRETCEATKGLIEEGEELMGKDADDDVKDAMLISAAQKIEHYEIASYGTLCTWAEILGEDRVHDLLGQTLDEEKSTDDDLTALAKSKIDRAAAA